MKTSPTNDIDFCQYDSLVTAELLKNYFLNLPYMDDDFEPDVIFIRESVLKLIREMQNDFDVLRKQAQSK